MPGAASASASADSPAGESGSESAREWLALPGGGIRRVVTVEDELLAHAAYAARPVDPCSCGRPRLGSGRSCGSAKCIARLHQAAEQ